MGGHGMYSCKCPPIRVEPWVSVPTTESSPEGATHVRANRAVRSVAPSSISLLRRLDPHRVFLPLPPHDKHHRLLRVFLPRSLVQLLEIFQPVHRLAVDR